MNRRAALLALLSAALFGRSTPAAKVRTGSIDPTVVAGLMYRGAGIGFAMLTPLLRSVVRSADSAEAPIARADLPWLADAIVAVGIAGPLLLMFGLSHTDATSASLLLTLESAATALLAWFVFG